MSDLPDSTLECLVDSLCDTANIGYRDEFVTDCNDILDVIQKWYKHGHKTITAVFKSISSHPRIEHVRGTTYIFIGGDLIPKQIETDKWKPHYVYNKHHVCIISFWDD